MDSHRVQQGINSVNKSKHRIASILRDTPRPAEMQRLT